MKKKVKKAAPVITEKNWGEIDATIRSVADRSKTKKALLLRSKSVLVGMIVSVMLLSILLLRGGIRS